LINVIERLFVRKSVLTALAVFVCLALAVPAAWADVKTLFPDMDGWEPEGDPEVYEADNLFEYINGSADLYLTYDFKEMGTVSYFDDQGRGLTIDIYEHGDANNAFGIYSQERPSPANFVEIGAQGYYDFGVLNFCRGSYYVKILGYDLGEFDEEMLTVVAKIVSQKIGGKKKLPPVLACFPKEAIVDGSERFISENFLGHGFLHSAFVVEYRADRNTNTRGFIIAAHDDTDADQMLESYLTFVREQGGTVSDDNGVYRFEDPMSRSTGAISLKKSGSYVWGLSTKAETTGAGYVAGVEQNLKAAGLLK
jgi:hypothetical protein